MLLENKNAVIHGGRGSIGGAVTCVFAHEGTAAFLTGRTRQPLEVSATNTTVACGNKYRESVSGEDG